ncbi:hypothetical protein Tco_0112466, partial [Tanacetum coccineum]
ATNIITFTFSSFDKPLSFNLDDFSSIASLKYSENYVSIPPKETERAGLATLGLVDEKDSTLSSTDLVNSSLLCWGLNVDIGNIPFSDLVAKLINGRRKGKRMSAILDICLLSLNICWAKTTRMISSRLFIPNHISATSFKTSFANEVALIPHMLKVENISIEPE